MDLDRLRTPGGREALRETLATLRERDYASLRILPLAGKVQHLPLDACHVVRALRGESNLFHKSAMPGVYRSLARHASAEALDLFDLFHLGREVAEARVARALPAPLLSRLVELGLITRGEAGLRAEVMVTPFERTLCLSDRLDARERDDYVYAGRSSFLPYASILARHGGTGRGRLLDLGCGAGVIALSLAGEFTEVEGTDIVPRCLAYARINSALNGVGNARWYESDLYAKTPGRYDLILSNPPCGWFDPERETGRTFSSGGAEWGTEFPAAVLGGGYDRLAPGGLLCSVLTCPVFGARSFLDGLIEKIFSERPASITVYPLFSEFSYHRARVYREAGISKIVRYLLVVRPSAAPVIERAYLDRLRWLSYSARALAPRIAARVLIRAGSR